MFHKIEEIKPLKNYIIKITFQDKTIKFYDVSKLFTKWLVFQDLKNIKGLFEKVKVDKGGYGISWNEEIDLSCEELWYNGKPEKEKLEDINRVAEDDTEYN